VIRTLPRPAPRSAIVAALAAAAACIPAAAALPSGFYAAELTAQPAKGKFVARQLVWNCEGANCAATQKSPSRAELVCASLAREAGEVKAFRAGKVVFDAPEIARCNGAA